MTNCIFCRIVNRALPAKVVYEDERAMVFEDVNPQAPVHLLVIPKQNIESVQGGQHDPALLGHLLLVCVRMAREKGIADSGYRVVTNTGPQAGQTVFHLHLHILGGRPMSWPPG
jgi:histidine triad (HIT) family protein